MKENENDEFSNKDRARKKKYSDSFFTIENQLDVFIADPSKSIDVFDFRDKVYVMQLEKDRGSQGVNWSREKLDEIQIKIDKYHSEGRYPYKYCDNVSYRNMREDRIEARYLSADDEWALPDLVVMSVEEVEKLGDISAVKESY